MKVNYKWLQEYIDGELNQNELEDVLTFAGIEVEGVEKIGKEIEHIIIAEIVEREKHPNADKLSVCRVFDGENYFQVVCGAPNCDAGKKIAFAPIGTAVGNITIGKIELRGVESSGMICSEKELNLSDDHAGIMILPDDAPLGKSLAVYLNRSDICYELEITPNRPDLLGVIGIARDVAAATKNSLKLPEIQVSESDKNIVDYLKLTNDNPLKCTRYTGRIIFDVTVQESPEWLKNRLLSIGLRPINNVVDITNFVMMEFGHPLHAFDYDKISAHHIIVRDAKIGEKFYALDDETYELDEHDLVIADSEKPIALAGVIGGSNSHITEETKNVVIEAANFLYSTVRKTSGKHKIFTDSSYRFERDIADETAEIVSARAAQLILEIAGGELCSGMLDSFPQPLPQKKVALRLPRLIQLTTVPFSTEQVIEYLSTLELTFIEQHESTLLFSIPAFRKDLTREIDLIEEVIRLHGYNNVQEAKERSAVMNKVRFYQRRKLQDICINYGFHEVVNWTFASPEDLQKINISEHDERLNWVGVKNPLGANYSILRTSLLPGLLKNAIFNLSRGNEDISLFENTKVFFQDDSKLALEKEFFAGLSCGNFSQSHWSHPSAKVDFFHIKGLLEECLSVFEIEKISFQPSKEPFYQMSVAADVLVNNQKVASLGKLDEKVLERFEIETQAYYFEIDFSLLTEIASHKKITFEEFSKYPTITRDLSFIVPMNVTVSEISDAILGSGVSEIQKVLLFDEYKGKNIREGWRSLSFSMQINSFTKTLTDEYVNNLLNSVIEMLKKKYQIEMR
jgi:phenylalanyl-tRNA synthetase beta chain